MSTPTMWALLDYAAVLLILLWACGRMVAQWRRSQHANCDACGPASADAGTRKRALALASRRQAP